MRADLPGKREWQVQVASEQPHQPVRLSWPDMSQVPAGLRPILVDDATGRRVYMRTSSAYDIAADDAGAHRKLRITMDSTASPGLMVTALAAQQAGTGAAQISFTLSAAADADVSVLNIAGRPVRRIPLGLRESGTQTTSWNLRDDAGSIVPSGLYLVRVHVADEEGRRNQTLGTLQISR